MLSCLYSLLLSCRIIVLLLSGYFMMTCSLYYIFNWYPIWFVFYPGFAFDFSFYDFLFGGVFWVSCLKIGLCWMVVFVGWMTVRLWLILLFWILLMFWAYFFICSLFYPSVFFTSLYPDMTKSIEQCIIYMCPLWFKKIIQMMKK